MAKIDRHNNNDNNSLDLSENGAQISDDFQSEEIFVKEKLEMRSHSLQVFKSFAERIQKIAESLL